MRARLTLPVIALLFIPFAVRAAEKDVFDRSNLVAWCIVPFDAAKRGPEARAQMLSKLGITKLAYDWRGEHIPTFDDEVVAMKRHHIDLTAWWTAPPDLSETNRKILDVVHRRGLKTQFWVLIGDPDPKLPQAQRVKAAATSIRPFALEAEKVGCQVGLYNHGGWFGEPENQLEILKELALSNVGIVYNLHHGHAHVDRFPEILRKLRPHLLCLNLNGMERRGDELGKKILPIGAGDLDLELCRAIRASGYRGPIGILNHTDLDAEARLEDNLKGLDWIVRQLDGHPAGPFPKMRTYSPEKTTTSQSSPPSSVAAIFPPEAVELAKVAAAKGNAVQGAEVFASPKYACLSCHRVGDQGGTIGPDLSRIGATVPAAEIAESLLWPKKKVKPEYVAVGIATDRGEVRQGYIIKAEPRTIHFKEATSGKTLAIPKSSIVEQQELGSLMPDGLAASMSFAERRDLLRFLLELGHSHGKGAERYLAHRHQPVSFEYQAGPMQPADWRFARHPVNRDRLYDFYSKEAEFFRQHDPAAGLLPAFPGLDGGKQGHWGNQSEDTWRDDRWNRMDLGSVMSGVFHAGQMVVPRAVCVRLGEKGELAACFNPDTLQVDSVWRGGFVRFSDVRHGFLDGLIRDGQAVPFDWGSPARAPFRYRGFYRHGERVVFVYDLNGQKYWDLPEVVNGRFTRTVVPAGNSRLEPLTKGGPTQWPQVFETHGALGQRGPYAIDTIEPPFDNPWRSLLFFGGHDFLPDGSAMLCTMQGEVWHVSGLDARLEHVRWKRFASGLHQPLGLVVVDGQAYVLGRDQITRLHDLNGDDEADFYECFSQAYATSAAGHDYSCGLERDAAGNFYTASGKEGLVKIYPDGQVSEVLATGFRNPDGLACLPDGSVTVPVSEGDWTATSMICLVTPATGRRGRGEIPGYIPPHFGYGGPKRGRPPRLPLVYIPRGLDNSSGGQTYVDSSQWGPLAGQLLHFSYGAGTYFLVLRDEVGGQAQGAVVPMKGDFSSGVHRGRFNPRDGQLYVTGMAGWGTYTAKDGCFERVRYTGAPVQLPAAFHVHQNGVHLTFTAPLDPSIAGKAAEHFAQVWNYRYGPAYGSPEFAPSHPNTPGHDRLAITRAVPLPDGKSLFLEMPELQPVNQLHLRVRTGPEPAHDIFATVHEMDAPFIDLPDYRPASKTIAAHPILRDMAVLLHPPAPNPWNKKLPGARTIRLEAGKNLTYSATTLAARAGEAIELVFVNPDVVPHNWVLARSGSLSRVGELVNRMVADPEAQTRHYVPLTDDVLAYTDIVSPGQEFHIFFRAPATPGRYPFLCSFPGHWMVMNGQLVVR